MKTKISPERTPPVADKDLCRALRKRQWGQLAERKETTWAVALAMLSDECRKESVRRGELTEEKSAEYQKALWPWVSAQIGGMCSAAYRGNPAPFLRLAQAVEALKCRRFMDAGGAWADRLSQEIVTWKGGRRHGRAFNVEVFMRETACAQDRKSVVRRIRELGYRTQTGRPKLKR